jgi:hypothetical protein
MLPVVSLSELGFMGFMGFGYSGFPIKYNFGIWDFDI